nr:F-box protein At3g07870-like [Aegilops tauschii subsp. strangulata]
MTVVFVCSNRRGLAHQERRSRPELRPCPCRPREPCCNIPPPDLHLDEGGSIINGAAQEEDVPARRRLLRPFDEGLVADILARLPTKSVLRFRAACKEWLRIIDSPAFVARHARRRPLEVLLYTRTTVASVEQQGLDALDVCAHRPATRRPLASFPGRDGTWKPYCSLLASCDGLLLLREDGAVDVDGAEHYLICNPATRQWSHLPRLTRGAGGQQDGRATHRESGFYFHEPSGEYRLLCHITFLDQAPYYCIFSAGANEPRWLSVQATAIEDTIIAADQATMAGNQCFKSLMTPALLHGQLHWLEHMEAGRTDQMVAFDTAAETFRRMPPPPVTRKGHSQLLVADGSLMASEPGHLFVDLWVLEGYGGGGAATKGTWERRHRVDVQWLITRPLLVAGRDGGDASSWDLTKA